MNNESFWKNFEKRMLPTDREPPLWTMMTVVILLCGIAAWQLGLPWQGALPVTLFLLLLAIGGRKLSKRFQREGYDTLPAGRSYYSNRKPMTPAEKTRSRWITFWFILILIPLYLSMKLFFEAIYQYSWPVWFFALPPLIITILLVPFVLLYKRSKKLYEKRHQYEQNPQCSFGKELNMNQGTNNTLSPAQQELKLKARKILLPVGLLFIAGFAILILSFSTDVSRIVSILMMTIGGFCWGIAGALMLPVYQSAIQIQQGKSEPQEQQAPKKNTKIKRLQIAVVVLITVLMLVASLFIFQ